MTPSGTHIAPPREVGDTGKVEITLSERGVRSPPAFLEADGEHGSPSQGPLRLQHWGGRLGPQQGRGQSERRAGAHQPLSGQASAEPHRGVARGGGQTAVGAGAFGRAR